MSCAPWVPDDQLTDYAHWSIQAETCELDAHDISRALSGTTPQRLVDHHRLRNALQIELPHLYQLEPVRRHCAPRVLAHEDLIRTGLRRDTRSDVHRPAEVVTLVVDHRPSVHANVGWW